MIDLLVSLAVIGALAYTLAWALSPKMRAWSERPKYKFQERLK
jgi:hypothetical protein